MATESFPAKDRVRRQADYARVFKTGAHAADATLVILGCPNPSGGSRLGVVVSRKVGNAVIRNAWKRRIRDVFRRQRDILPVGWDLVVRPRRGARLAHALINQSLPRLAEQVVQRYNDRLGRDAQQQAAAGTPGGE